MHNERTNEWECPDCGVTYPYSSTAEARRFNKLHECDEPGDRECPQGWKPCPDPDPNYADPDQRERERIEQEAREAFGLDDSAEVTVVNDETGGAKGRKPQRMDLLPWDMLLELAEHYAKGAEKYDDHNWRKGYDWSLSKAAAQRHLAQFWMGEDRDPETGTKHVLAAAFHCLTLAYFMDEHPSLDDRPRSSSDG